MSMKQETKDLKKKRKIDEAGGSNRLVSKEELRVLMEPLAKPVLIDLLSKLGSEDPTIAEEIETIAYADSVHRRIFVRDLSLNTTTRSLRNAFKEYGEIEHGKVIVSERTRKSRGFGYIIYKDVKSVQKALRVPGKLIDGRMTHCMLASDEVTRKISDNTRKKLFIGNLSPQVTNGMLYNYFAGHGDIEECSVVYHKNTKESRGYGFLTYKTVEAAEKALVDLHNKTLEGKHINVQYAYPNKGGSGQSSIPPKTALPVPPKTEEASKNAIKDQDQSTLEGENMVIDADSPKGGVGQSSVPAKVPAGYAAPPSPNSYPQTDAPYVAPPNPYPQTDAPYAAPPNPYPQIDAHYAAPPNPYPQTDAPYAAPPNPYPQTDAPYAAPPNPYPQTDAPYALPPYPYPQTDTLYAAPPYPYPQYDAPDAAPPYPYPQTDAPYAAPPYPYPQTDALYAAPPYPYPQTAAPNAASQYPSLRPGPSTYQTHGYGQNPYPYPQHYYQNQ